MLFSRFRQQVKEDNETLDRMIAEAEAEQNAKNSRFRFGLPEPDDYEIVPYAPLPHEANLISDLSARAWLTEVCGETFKDAAAVRLMNQFDLPQTDSVLPEKILDSLATEHWIEVTKTYLEIKPKSAVVHIGCGVQALFRRLDNGKMKWVSVDSPAVLELRRKLGLDTGSRVSQQELFSVAEWIRDFSWSSKNGMIIILEEFTSNYSAKEAKTILQTIQGKFPDALVMFRCKTIRSTQSTSGFCLFDDNANNVFHRWLPSKSTRVYVSEFLPKSFLNCRSVSGKLRRGVKQLTRRGGQVLIDIRV